MAKKKTAEFGVIHFVYIIVISLLTAGLTFKLMNMGAQNDPELKVVYFDAQAITQQFMKVLSNKDFKSAEEARTVSEIRSQDFAARLVTVVEDYENNGYFVMEKSQLMGAPLKNDITVEVAKKMNVKINYRPSGIREKWISKFKEKSFGL